MDNEKSLKEETNLTDSNFYITKDIEGHITAYYFLPNNTENGIKDIKFNIKGNKLTITGFLRETKNDSK